MKVKELKEELTIRGASRIGIVGQSFSSAAHRAAEAASSMRALHSMRARAASSPTRPWWLRRAMTSSCTGCIISLEPGR
eukprot:4045596-Prymnesium_polylepis.1